MFDEFLKIRETEDGKTLLDLFLERETTPDGWSRYPFRQFDERSLPDSSDGPFAHEWYQTPRWVTYFHGVKVEGIFSVLASVERHHGGLKASGDRESGQRYNEEGGRDKKGVYFHTEGNKKKAMSYAHFAPVFGNGCYVQVCIECVCDFNYRTPYTSTQTRRSRFPTANAKHMELSTKEDPASATKICG
jgi:hypothetical protein